MDVFQMGAATAAAAISRGELTSEELVQSCLNRIDAVDGEVQAWAHLDHAHALTQARAADKQRQAGRPLGPLHGVPVGVKDIFDTSDMPTEDGSVLRSGRTPGADAAAVALLRASGAVILGKTVTTEFAVYGPGKTRNPHDPARTPGGSSSGSAAAVAAGMVPLALGTQTNGSVIRPASYCGVYGFKPSHGLISRHRVLKLSGLLDHVGMFGRSLEDLALLTEQLAGYDARDLDTHPVAKPRMVAITREAPPMPPRLALIKGPAWDQAEPDVVEGFAEMSSALGDQIEEVQLPGNFEDTMEWHRVIMEADLALNLARDYRRGADTMSPRLREMIKRGLQEKAVQYNLAAQQRPLLREFVAELMLDFDAIITPSANGEAPLGLDSTGSPAFATLWSFCGAPAVSVPVLRGANAMPIGVQLVSAWGDDARLLRTARWLAEAAPGE
jgi:Asp-tRNA(Asn)/Glu-tRNA(Gln) amidotransferase A subunit family amidase